MSVWNNIDFLFFYILNGVGADNRDEYKTHTHPFSFRLAWKHVTMSSWIVNKIFLSILINFSFFSIQQFSTNSDHIFVVSLKKSKSNRTFSSFHVLSRKWLCSIEFNIDRMMTNKEIEKIVHTVTDYTRHHSLYPLTEDVRVAHTHFFFSFGRLASSIVAIG